MNPCKACGSTFLLQCSDFFDENYWVECSSCHATSEPESTRKEADERWNSDNETGDQFT